MREVPVASATASSSGISQISSPSKQKYSTPRQVLPVADHVGAPGPEVLDPPGARPGVVEVDPVVRERLVPVIISATRQSSR